MRNCGLTFSVISSSRINIGDFDVKRIIGRGNFADVKLAREKSSGNVYALKVVKKAGEKVSAFYEEERDIMARAASPWLTKLDYAFQVVEGKRAALCLGQQCEHLRFR